MTKLSIITINYNNRKGLKKTIASVFNQTFTNYEYLIIDGGSSDGSAEEIKPFADKLAYWVSEPDKGIYHAMNKGIKKATGEYCLFLNSGDCLAKDNVIEKLYLEINHEDIIYGNWYKSYSDGHIEAEKFPKMITFYFLAFLYSLPHQASLIKRDLFDKIGYYDEQLNMVSDWKFFMLAIFKFNCSYKHIDLYIAVYDKTGFSSDPKNNELQQNERRKVLESEFTNLLYLKNEANLNILFLRVLRKLKNILKKLI